MSWFRWSPSRKTKYNLQSPQLRWRFNQYISTYSFWSKTNKSFQKNVDFSEKFRRLQKLLLLEMTCASLNIRIIFYCMNIVMIDIVIIIVCWPSPISVIEVRMSEESIEFHHMSIEIYHVLKSDTMCIDKCWIINKDKISFSYCEGYCDHPALAPKISQLFAILHVIRFDSSLCCSPLPAASVSRASKWNTKCFALCHPKLWLALKSSTVRMIVH